MKQEGLYHLEAEDWKVLEHQFAHLYKSTIAFVLDNNGSLTEAREVYVQAFVYYIQLLELKGFTFHQKAEGLIYSFARRIWLHKLEKRRVNLDFVRHRREFFEMEDAFHLIESINEKSVRTSDKLADIGEPYRTLLLEHIGRRKDLDEISIRLGYQDEARAFQALGQCFRKLIKLVEGKEFQIDSTRFTEMMRYALDGMDASLELTDEEKVALTMITRAISLVRNHVNRTERIARFQQMEEKLLPAPGGMLDEPEEQGGKSLIMKTISVFVVAVIAAVGAATLTAFGVTEALHRKQQAELAQQTIAVEEEVVEVEEAYSPPVGVSAFAIANGGYVLAPAWALTKASRVYLHNQTFDTTLAAQIISLDTLSGLALLKVSAELQELKRIPYRLAPDVPELGEPIFALSQQADGLHYAEGSMNTQIQKGGTEMLLSTASGAPVIETRGQIAGLIVEGSPSSDGKSKMLGSTQILDWLFLQNEKLNLGLELSQRNGFYYLDKQKQIAQMQTFVFEMKIYP